MINDNLAIDRLRSNLPKFDGPLIAQILNYYAGNKNEVVGRSLDTPCLQNNLTVKKEKKIVKQINK